MNLKSGKLQVVLDALRYILFLKKDLETDFVMFVYNNFPREYHSVNTGVEDPTLPLQRENIHNVFSVLNKNQEIINILTNLEQQFFSHHQGRGLKPKTIIIPDNKKDLLDRLQVIIAAKHAGHSDVEDEKNAILQKLLEKEWITEKEYKKFSRVKLSL